MDQATTVAVRILAIGAAFGLTIFVHEVGHFLSARLAGMAVYEFSIGFGRPLLLWFRRRGTQYSVRLWPFISYVRIAGMEPGDDHPEGFGRKSRPVQAIVLLSGCMMNFLLAVVVYVVMGVAIGLPVPTNRIESVLPDTPAAKIGLVAGDRILGVGQATGASVSAIREQIQSHPGRPLVLQLERKGRRLSVLVTPATEVVYDIKGVKLVKVPVGRIGVIFSSRVERIGIGRSVLSGFAATYDAVHLQIAGLVGMVMRTVPADVMGPVGVAHVLYSESKADWLQFLGVAAMLTVAVGFLNLLPVPALDGSRLVILVIEAIRGKPFDKRKEAVVHLVGITLLLFLGVVIAYRDVLRILKAGG